jgi:site-specific DNA-methyltransferase (adenine-specific)/modification methylase
MYRQGNIKILNVDCMEYLKGVTDKYFDLTVTSPPYNMNLRVNAKSDGYCSRQIVKELSSKYKSFDDNLPMDDYFEFLKSVVGQLLRVSNLVFFNIQIITGNKPAVFRLLGEYHDKIKELIVWDKCKAQPAIGEGVLNSGYELIIVFSDEAITRSFKYPIFERGRVDNIWRIQAEQSSDKNHGASFPRSLVGNILHNFSKPGQRIFDPFLGTGTTAIEAHYHDCEFVGCELDQDYYNSAVKRFELQTKQETLF